MSQINWRQCDVLGSGHYRDVRLYHDVKTGRKLAVKRYLISDTFNPTYLEEIQTLDKEIILLKNMQHERIVQYIGCELTDDFVFIFMEYMAGGSVKTEIKTKGKLLEPQVLHYTEQILQGLEYLHYYCKVVHRDIKNDNILRDLNGNVKIGDFGLSKQLETIQGKSIHGNTVSIGSNYFKAPEVITGQDYGRQADMWSLGCTIVEMLTGLPPWGELDEFAAMVKTGQGEEPKYDLPSNVSPNMQHFLKSLFSQDPTKRPTSTEALSKVSIFRRNTSVEIVNEILLRLSTSQQIGDLDNGAQNLSIVGEIRRSENGSQTIAMVPLTENDYFENLRRLFGEHNLFNVDLYKNNHNLNLQQREIEKIDRATDTEHKQIVFASFLAQKGLPTIETFYRIVKKDGLTIAGDIRKMFNLNV